MILEFILAILCFILAISLLSFAPLLIGAPYEPSRKKQVKKMIELACVKSGDKSVDLGSGDGRIVIEFARAGAEAHGYEVNPWLVMYSKYKAKKLGLKNAHFHLRNFWSVQMKKFDIVTSFQIGYIMPRLERKLKRELKSGTRIISNVWKFKDWVPKKIDGKIRLYIKN
ncbi:MAG: methyltransferase domain-containing protein [Nanoarchaeota archaeon]|nr:methyltransferase domain-containing protein [Nanoarchaeota archaeon]